MQTPITTPQDYGPIYTETIFGRFPVEPWNTYSNLIFLVIIVFFAYRTRLNYKRYPLIVIALPILLIGFIGGTLFHATRSDRIFLMMDYIPIFILCLLASYSFWLTLLKNQLLAVIVMFAPMIIMPTIRNFITLPISMYIGIGYSTLALSIIVPALLNCIRNKWNGIFELGATIVFFSIAILFRSIDTSLGKEFFPMGTHFLWHIFGGLSVFCLLNFILRAAKMEIKPT